MGYQGGGLEMLWGIRDMRMGNVMGYQGGGGECYEVSGRGRGDVMGYQDGGWGMLWGIRGGGGRN